MRARHREARPAEHDRRQRRRPVQDPDPAPPRLGQLGVVRPDRGRDHEGAGLAEVGRRVAHLHIGAERGELIELRRARGVAPRDSDPPGQHDARDPGHAGPADPGEVHPAQVADRHRRHRRDQAHLTAPPAVPRARSAHRPR